MRPLAAAAALSVAALAPAEHHVTVRDNAFAPSTVTVAVNDTVTWTNRGQAVHTVKVDGENSSGPMPPGTPHSDSFPTPGTRAYRCEIHSNMTGTIVVQAASTSNSSTTTTLRRSVSTTTTTAEPLGSSITAPADSTTTSTSLVEEATTTSSSTVLDAGATGVTDTAPPGDDNVDVPGALAAVLLLVTAAGAFAQTRHVLR